MKSIKKIIKYYEGLKKSYRYIINFFIFLIFSGIPTYFWYLEKLQGDAFEAYITAKNYYSSKQYHLALAYYEKAYNLESDLPNLSYEYGRTYFKLEDYAKAIAVWENVPHGEDHEYYEYYIARSYHYLINSQETKASKELYEKLAIKNYKIALEFFKGKEDPAYWYSRYGYIVLGSRGKSANLLEIEMNQFALDTRSFLSNLASFTLEVGTDFTILEDKYQKAFMLNMVTNEIMFKSYLHLAQKYLDESEELLSIETMLTAFEYQSHPYDIVRNSDIECALRGISKTISFQDIKYIEGLSNNGRFKKVLTNIYNLNLENLNMEISNIAAVLLNLYCKKDYNLVVLDNQKDLNLMLKFKVSDTLGLNSLKLNSLSFNYINREFQVKNKKSFDLDLKQSIFEIKKFDFVNIYCKNIAGGVNVETMAPYLSQCEDVDN